MSNEQLHTQRKPLILLKQLIATPSFSKEEDKTAAIIENFLKAKGAKLTVHFNNIWATNKYFDEANQLFFSILITIQ